MGPGRVKIVSTPTTKIVKIEREERPGERVRIIRFTEEGEVEEVVRRVREEIERTLKEELSRALPELKIESEEERLTEEEIVAVSDIFDALANEERLRILELLDEKSRYFVELREILGCSPSSLRLHLTKLMSQGLVGQEKSRGKYFITDKGRRVLRLVRRFREVTSLKGDHDEGS